MLEIELLKSPVELGAFLKKAIPDVAAYKKMTDEEYLDAFMAVFRKFGQDGGEIWQAHVHSIHHAPACRI
ncbi:MAG: hypothetical protein V1867_05655 [Candidatus Falkowbacteria bacterium]